jgi:hypothetical protein
LPRHRRRRQGSRPRRPRSPNRRRTRRGQAQRPSPRGRDGGLARRTEASWRPLHGIVLSTCDLTSPARTSRLDSGTTTRPSREPTLTPSPPQFSGNVYQRKRTSPARCRPLERRQLEQQFTCAHDHVSVGAGSAIAQTRRQARNDRDPRRRRLRRLVCVGPFRNAVDMTRDLLLQLPAALRPHNETPVTNRGHHWKLTTISVGALRGAWPKYGHGRLLDEVRLSVGRARLCVRDRMQRRGECTSQRGRQRHRRGCCWWERRNGSPALGRHGCHGRRRHADRRRRLRGGRL